VELGNAKDQGNSSASSIMAEKEEEDKREYLQSLKLTIMKGLQVSKKRMGLMGDHVDSKKRRIVKVLNVRIGKSRT